MALLIENITATHFLAVLTLQFIRLFNMKPFY